MKKSLGTIEKVIARYESGKRLTPERPAAPITEPARETINVAPAPPQDQTGRPEPAPTLAGKQQSGSGGDATAYINDILTDMGYGQGGRKGGKKR